MKRIASLSALFLLSASLAFSWDFGLWLDQRFEPENKLFVSKTGLAPWFSWDGGKGLSVYLSGFFSAQYNNSDDGYSGNDGFAKPELLPELTRFALSYQSGQNYSFEVGRIFYTDALGVTASGLFDGFHFDATFAPGTLSAGVYYTGLQYRERAEVLMTRSDRDHYGLDPRQLEDYSDYFASRRLFVPVRWDMPIGELNNLSFEALFQVDLNGRDDTLHSQYGEIQLDIFALSGLRFSVGAFGEAMEGMEDANDLSLGFGALGIIGVELPLAVSSGLKFTTRYCSGPWNDTVTAFTPISAHALGMVFPGTFSGIWENKLNFDVRVVQSLFFQSALSYYTQTYSEQGSNDYLYGGEVSASFAWQPIDDLQIYFGGGLFFPQLGNIYPTDTGTMWKISAGLSMAF